MINIRKFEIGDEENIWNVFYSSIHQICSKDYAREQVDAWAPKHLDSNIWAKKIQSICPFVATIENTIVGYADIQSDGKIDHFFVHGDHQSKGVGKLLMTNIFENATKLDRLYSEVSNTAKPFFIKYGFNVKNQQQVEIRGITLTNNLMEYYK